MSSAFRRSREKEIMTLITKCNESMFCGLLAEAIQELSPDFCRQMLKRRSLETEDLSSYWYTAMCKTALGERVENGCSTYEMLEVLKDFGANPKFRKCQGVRMMFFDLADDTEEMFEHTLQAAEFFLTRTNITSADLSCKKCCVDDFRLLEIWFKKDLDIVLSRNVRRVLKAFSDKLKNLEQCLSTLKILPGRRIRFGGEASLPKSLIFLIVSFTIVRVGSHKLANWHVEPSRYDYDGRDMFAKKSNRGVPVFLGDDDEKA